MLNKRYEYRKRRIRFRIEDGHFLNSILAISQNLTQTDVDKLKRLHSIKNSVLKKMEETDIPSELKTLANDITIIEFDLQKAWGFPQDINKHYWNSVPKCVCPEDDNRQYYGTEYKIVNSSCPVHGNSQL